MATVHSDQDHQETNYSICSGVDKGNCSETTFHKTPKPAEKYSSSDINNLAGTENSGRKLKALKRVRRPEDLLDLEELGENLSAFGASLRKRRPDVTSSGESNGSSPVDSRNQLNTSKNVQPRTKKNCSGLLEPVMLTVSKGQKKAFPCFSDKSIFTCESKLRFASRLRKQGFDNDADTSSEELENAKQSAISSLTAFALKYKSLPVSNQKIESNSTAKLDSKDTFKAEKPPEAAESRLKRRERGKPDKTV